MKERILSLILALSLCLSSVFANVYATTNYDDTQNPEVVEQTRR